jgi:deoxyribodipyrimidine photo-lyase
MSYQLCWLRADLRMQDNSALIQAIETGPTVVIYIATPEQWQWHDDAPIKIDFWRRNLQVLEQELQAQGIPLICFQVPAYQQIPALITKIIKAWAIQDLHYNIEYPLNESQRDAAVAKVCQQMQVSVHAYEDQCLLPPDLVLTQEGKPFKVFTPYANKCREYLQTSAPVSSYGLSWSSSKQKLKTLQSLPEQRSLAALDWPVPQKSWQSLWPAGEEAAQGRLANFVKEKIADYQERRDFPAQEGTSTLSPYLAAGLISVRQCWEQAQGAGANASVRSWCNELLWRDFYKYVMHHYPHVCRHEAWNPNYAAIPWRQDEADFKRWCQGETGFPLIDAAMKQLLETGWMHNRLRMLVAMFLSKNLLLDWRWGERWFMQHLVDGDFAANNGGWQWSASTGTDAAPYFRIFNPVRQSERFDPQGEFIRHYIPALKAESSKTIHDPEKLKSDYPEPMVDLKFSRDRALSTFRH